MVVSEDKRPQYRPQNAIVHYSRDHKNRTPNFGKPRCCMVIEYLDPYTEIRTCNSGQLSLSPNPHDLGI